MLEAQNGQEAVLVHDKLDPRDSAVVALHGLLDLLNGTCAPRLRPALGMVKVGARLKDVCDEGLGLAIRKAYNRLLTEELHVAQIKAGWGQQKT